MIGLKFWRVCIDEAQMVECKGTKLVEMSLRISALHRWCVTGTPVQKRIEGTNQLFKVSENILLKVDFYIHLLHVIS